MICNTHGGAKHNIERPRGESGVGKLYNLGL